MTLEEAQARITALEKEKADLASALTAEKAREKKTEDPPPLRPGVTARQLAAVQEELEAAKKEIADIKKGSAPPEAKKGGGFLKAR